MSKARKINFKTETTYEGRDGLVYARVSSKRQEREGSGLLTQEGRCKQELAYNKVPYDRSFYDSYTGGGDFMKRPAMKELLAYLDARPHKKYVVIFDDLKRFARDVEFHFKLKSAFRARDVMLKCLNYNFDESPEGQFAELIMAGQAELERKQNTRQVIQKHKERLEMGYWAFGSKRGYKMTKHPIHKHISIPVEPDATYLKEAIQGFLEGTFVHKVDACSYLVEKGFWSKQKPERYIDKFSQILTDPFYAGFIEYPQWEISRRQGHHEGIVSPDVFEAVQKRLNQECRGKRVRRDVSKEFPLRGLLVCSECKGHLTGAFSKGRGGEYAYYFCQDQSCSEFRNSIPKHTIESNYDLVLKNSSLKIEIENVLQVIFERMWGKQVDHFKYQMKESEKLKAEKEGEIKELTNLLIKAKKSSVKQIYEKQIEALADEIEELSLASFDLSDLKVPYRTALDKSILLLKNPYTVWHSVDVREKQRLFFFIFDEKLPYSRMAGYRTDKIPSAIRLFEEFVVTNSQQVEMAGIEPASESGTQDVSTVRRRSFDLKSMS